MCIVAVVIAALLTLAFAAFAAQKAAEPVVADAISAARSASFASASAAPGGHIRVASAPVAEMSDATSVTRPAGARFHVQGRPTGRAVMALSTRFTNAFPQRMKSPAQERGLNCLLGLAGITLAKQAIARD
jgi:hypothetical protein